MVSANIVKWMVKNFKVFIILFLVVTVCGGFYFTVTAVDGHYKHVREKAYARVARVCPQNSYQMFRAIYAGRETGTIDEGSYIWTRNHQCPVQ